MDRLKQAFLALAIVFAGKALIRPDAAAVIGMTLWLIAYGILEFYGQHSVREAFLREMAARTQELDEIRGTLKQITLSMGMRGTRIDKSGS